MSSNSSHFVKNTAEGIARVKKGQYAYLLEVLVYNFSSVF